jgi:hypothetical protein
LRSFRHWTGRELIEAGSDSVSALDLAPFPVLSHGSEPDPILNYGNRLALRLWEMEWEEFIRTPSRFTAEAPVREERARFLAQVASRGFVENYSGVRISKTGKRFRISGGIVWSLIDESGSPVGQVATFDSWVAL